MDSPFFATPVARQGPTSRLLKRRSEKPATPQMEPSFTTTPTGPIRKGNTTNVSFAVPFTSRTYKPSMTMGEQDETVAWEATRFVTTISPATVIITNRKLGHDDVRIWFQTLRIIIIKYLIIMRNLRTYLYSKGSLH